MKTQNKNVFTETQRFHPIIAILILGMNIGVVFYYNQRLLEMDMGVLITFISSLLLPLILIVIANLRTQISNNSITFKFFPFFISKEVKLSDISILEVKKNRMVLGWGIRLTDDGWLYNTRGRDYLEIRLKNGKTIKLGTQKAEELEKVIDNLTLDK
tara:strand:+ start:175 stop:645 length:471 start_codon:yes stop_codon:yes gene_type:complete